MKTTEIYSIQSNFRFNIICRTRRFASEIIQIAFTILIITVFFPQNSIAKNYMQWSLPEGAKIRIGKGGVETLRFSPDGNRLIVGSSIGFWIYDAHSGDELDLILANQSNIIGVSPDAQMYVEKNIDNTVNVYNLADRSVRATLQGDNSDIFYVRFNLNKNILASDIGSDIHVWDLNTGEIRTSIDLEVDWISNVVLSPDGTKLASLSSGSEQSALQLWDVSTGSHITTLTKFARSFRDLMFAPDGNILLSSSDSSIQLWDLSTGKKTISFRTPSIRSIAISPDGKTLATGGYEGLYLWNLESGTLKTELSGHLGFVVNSITFSPDGRTIVSGGYGDLSLWDVESGARKMAIANHSSSVNSITFSPDNKTFAIGHWYKINLWDTVNLQLKSTFIGSRFTYNTSLDFSLDGSILASVIWGGISLWDVNIGVPIGVVSGYGSGSGIRGTRSGYSSVVFSPDGQLLAGANGDTTIHLLKGGRTYIGSLIGHTDSVTSIAFNNSGRFLASGSYDNTVRLWDVVEGTNISTFEGHTDVVYCVDLSPDARHIASGSKDKSIIIWDVQSGNQKYVLTGHTDEVHSVKFSPDGQTLVSGGDRDDSTVWLWKVNTGTEIATLTGHTRGNTNIAFASDGKTFASGSSDGTAILWDLSAFIDIENITTHRNEDVNRDGLVTIDDLIIVATQFGQSGVGNSADVNGDGVVDVKDILLVAAALTDGNGAPAVHSSITKTLSANDVQQWLNNAYQVNSYLPDYKRGITVLEHLLTLLIPDKTKLLPNYPNPFNPDTWIPYQLAKDADVTIHIHSSKGQLVRSIQLGNQPAGIYMDMNRAAYWDGNNELGEPVASGIYYYTLTVGNVNDTRRMVIQK